MNFLFVLFLMLAGAGVLAYLKAPLALATAATGIGLFVLNGIAAGTLSGLLMFGAWLGWIGMLLLNFDKLRRRYLTAPVFAFFRKSLPAMSQTERDALDAGTVWWDAELFSGAPQWRALRSAGAIAQCEAECPNEASAMTAAASSSRRTASQMQCARTSAARDAAAGRRRVWQADWQAQWTQWT